MPSTFRCTSCSLRFTIGWAHFVSFDGGYGGITRLVCCACGTEHAVEIAMRDRGPKRFVFYDVDLVKVPDTRRLDVMKLLRARFDMTLDDAKAALDALPLKIASRVSKQIADDLLSGLGLLAKLEVVEVALEPNPTHGPLLPDRFLSRNDPRFGDDESFEQASVRGPVHGPNEEFDLSVQRCSSCQAVNTLVDEIEQIGNECPHCRESSIECVESCAT